MDANALMRFAGNVDGLIVMTALAALGITPANGGPLGFTKRGTPIWPIAGADNAGLEAKMEALTGELAKLVRVREESNPAAKGSQGDRYAAASDASGPVAAQLAELAALKATMAEDAQKAAVKAQIDEAVKAAMRDLRGPSMAAVIGDGSGTVDQRSLADRMVKASPLLEQVFGAGYTPGSFLGSVAAFKGFMSDGIDIDQIQAGKAKLQELGLYYAGPATFSTGKATLGNTSAGGGYVLPNNLVDAVIKPKTQAAVYRNLITVIPNVTVRGIDQPYRLGAPARMTYADWGQTKENVDEGYGSYTANLVTFARIYDIGKQYLRFSAGSAERDVLDELAKAADLAENYEVMVGPGSGSIGSGDACLGIFTSLNATPAFLGYKTAKTGAASASTIVGSFAAAINELNGLLAARNRSNEAVIVDSTTYFSAIAQGSDTAGFWVSPTGGPTGFSRNESGQLTYWGVPIFYDTNLTANGVTSKVAMAGEWKQFKLYRGMEFRIDSSDQAGTRWDKNLVGFRGEMELGFNAESPVHVGAAQLMTAVIP